MVRHPQRVSGGMSSYVINSTAMIHGYELAYCDDGCGRTLR
jgi:hypothetical protein